MAGQSARRTTRSFKQHAGLGPQPLGLFGCFSMARSACQIRYCTWQMGPSEPSFPSIRSISLIVFSISSLLPV